MTTFGFRFTAKAPLPFSRSTPLQHNTTAHTVHTYSMGQNASSSSDERRALDAALASVAGAALRSIVDSDDDDGDSLELYR